MFNKKTIYFLFSCLVTIVVFAIFFKEVSIHDVKQIIFGVDLNILLVFFVFSISSSIFRTWRFALMLAVSGFAPSKLGLFLVVLVRNFCSDLLPARLGSWVYVYILNSRLGVPLSAALSSFAITSIFDVFAVVFLVLIAAWIAATGGNMSPLPFIVGGIFLGLIGLAALIFLPKVISIFNNFLSYSKLIGKDTTKKINTLANEFINEVNRPETKRIYFPLLILSILIRVGKYAGMYAFLYAMLKPLAYTIESLSISKSFLAMFAAEIAASTPISGIAGFGVYEGVWKTLFIQLGFPTSLAEVTAISHHLFTQVYGYVLGLIALGLLLLPYFSAGKLKKVSNSMKVNKYFYLKTLASCLVVFILIFFATLIPFSKAQNIQPKANQQALTEVEEQLLKKFSNKISSKIIFDSNLSGTFGIYVINVDGTGTKALYDSDWHEIYPDLSPDGREIIFAKTPSLMRVAPSEVWIMNIDGSNARKLIEHGTAPTFNKDGSKIFFERDRKKVMVINKDGANLKKLFPKKKFFNKNIQVVKPVVSPDEKYVAFTSDHPDPWNAWYAEIETNTLYPIARGCEPTWFPDSKNIAFINKTNVKAKSAIFNFDLETNKISLLQDEGPPRGHEYFAKISADSKYLLYAASPYNQHDHNSSNYELYIKDLESGEFVMITRNGFTNRWPKFLYN